MGQIGSFSFLHYFDTYSSLKYGEIDFVGILVLLAVILICFTASIFYFEYPNIYMYLKINNANS